MKRKAFIRKIIKKIENVDYSVEWLACMHLNTIESEIAHAVMTGIINLDDYKELTNLIKEVKNELAK